MSTFSTSLLFNSIFYNILLHEVTEFMGNKERITNTNIIKILNIVQINILD